MRCGPTGLTVMMANFTRLYFLVAAVVLCWLASRCLQGISAIDDFTCITKPRIDFDNEDTYIVAYLHGGSATLSFARTTFTRTGGDDPGQLDLPRDNQPEPASSLEGDEISILRLPSSGGKTRIGFFACKKGDDVSIGTAIMSRNAYYLPTFPSHTVNNGDSVTLTVNATNTSFTATRWRKNEENPPGLIDTPEKVIDSADESDRGTYEIHLTEKRSAGQQALIRLFVRECEENKWSTPSCDKVCKVCFNGGVCEVASGVCICPPGFSGDFCEILLGPDRFGQDGSFRCSSSELLGSTCEGKLFCLPDPYGCSCASGYKGIDCDEGCPDGSFGASCLQTCHCMDDAPCNKTTGRCPGNCASGFKGINCQDGCPEGHGGLADDCSTLCTVPAEVTELQDVTPLSLSANQIHLSWKFVSNRCAVTCYQVQYELTNLEQCQPMEPNRIDVGGDSYYGDSLTISSGVRPYSSYTVFVRAWNEVGLGSEMPLNIRTGESVPSVAPVHTGSSISSDSITVYWEPIPCGRRGGDITGYDYEVQDSTGTRIGDRQSVQTEMAVVSGLTPCLRYAFRVRAQTNGGPGPWTNPIQVPGLLDQFLVDRTTEPTEIRVTWQEPSNIGNCPVQYTVEYSLIKRGLCERIDSPSRQVWSGDTRPPVTIRELHPRSLYHVYVRASTTTGPGMMAEGEAVTSERTSSVAPVITGHNSSSDSITFYWEPIPCENRSGNITGYDYEVRDSRGAMIRDRQSVQTEMVVVSELTPCMRYTFRVWAVNSVGLLGTWTVGMEVETSARVPEMVNQLSVTGIPDDPTEIRITWQKPTNTGDCTVQYTVEYALINRDQCEETQSPSRTSWQAGTQSPVTITGLFPHSTYRVYVTASTVAGVGMEAEAEGVTRSTATIVAPVINGSSISSDSITFYWEPIPCGSRGSDLTGYVYKVRDSRGATIRDSQSVQTEMAVVSGLTPCMRYTFRVRAVNSVGLLGTWTERVEVETSARVPEMVNQLSVTGIPDDPTEIRITWQKPTNTGDCTVQYTVEYALINRDQCEETQSPSRTSWQAGTQSPVTITGLFPYSTYRVYVTASTVAGVGMEAEAEGVTQVTATIVAPVINGSSISSDSITFYWEPIPCGSRGSDLTGYVYKVRDSRGATIRDRQSVQTEMAVVSGLTPCMRYTFRVRAVNSVGLLGTWTERVEVETSARVPEMVNQLSVTGIPDDPTEIRITWQKPTNTGDCTVQYTVEYALINRDQCEETQSPSRTSWQAGTQSPVTITGLFPHSTYRVYVTASTVAGVGMEAEAEGVTQVTATIVAPVINGSSISSDSITFYWEPIPCGSRGSDLTGYDYEVRDSRGATIRDRQSVQTEMAVVSGLTPCMRYTFRVRAVNSVGLLGTWTEGMEVETSARGGVAQDAGRIDDFTCITKPRIDFDNEDTYIAAYLHGGSATLSFARTTFTRTGTSGEHKPSSLKLPPNHDILMLQSSEEGFSILQLPAVTNRKKRIGFFACRKNGGNVMSIGTAIMSRNADFLPTFPSWTVNRGNNVTLMVNASSSSRTQTRWRRNAKDPIKDWSDQLYMKMTSVSQSESTTYEVHFTGKRASGKQALMRLIVRGCEQDKWNAPCCDKTCPVCFNGGVCETRIGVCVCPPGFSGNFCEILLGPDRFGQDGSFQCSSDKLPGKTCEGKLFCLPDPYGCSCASGYKGIDCDEGCPDGSFGASCLQTCHCMDNAPCNKTTGRCPGNCASGFKGINCQDLCPEGYGGLAGNCSTRCTAPAEVTEFQDDTPLNLSANQIHLSWKFVSNRCAVTRYQVQYELTNLEQCQPMEPNRIDVEGDSYYGDSLIISSDVLPYSSYTVYVSAWNEMEKGPETSIDLCTGESVPSLAPVLTGSNISSESITFNWEPIPCGSRGGDITGYIYEVQDSTGTMVVDSQSVSTEMAEVVGLTPCTIYSFKVQAETSKGPGPWTEDMEVETSAVVPEMVNQLTVSGTPVPTEIQVTWQKPTNTGNCTVQYTVEYALINRDLCEGFPSPSRILWPTGTLSAMTITGVYPNSIYRVFVTASTIAGLGTKLWDEAVTQGTAPSGPPSNVSLSNFTLNTLSFAWDLPLCGQRNGNITHYRYNLTGIASRQTEQANISQASIEFMGLVPFTPYVLTVFAINIFGSGPAATIAVQTGAPSEPGSLSVSTVSETSVTLEWRPPLFPNGKVFKYKIDQRVVARPYNDSFTFDADSKYESQEIPDESMTSSTVYNLEPSTEYEFLVYIVTGTNVVGKKAKVESFTAPATGMTPPEKPTLSGKGQSSTSSITIQLASTTPSKYVTSYQVGVKNTKAGVDTNRRSAGSGLEFGHFTESPTSYVAAELPRRLPDVFVVGDDREYDGYFNPSLQEGASYEIYFGAVSRISDKEFSVVWNEDPLVVQVAGGLSSSRQGIGLTVGVAVAMSMLAAVALVLALVVIWKRHQRSVGKEDGPSRAPSELSLHSIHGKDQNISPLSPDSDTPPARPQEKLGPTANKKPAHSHLEDPVALSNLANHIKSKKSRNGFQQEYETLPVTPLHPWTVAKKSHNMKKNRYTNIVAYDHSRVVLQCPDDSPHSDYINASYINGYKQEAQYIACQGPTKASVVDMWRMLWQEQVGIIVMLTNLVENGKVKCEKYWPDSLQKYADFTVTNISEEVLTNYVVRTFHLSKYSDPEGVFRELNHFHYTTWPDMKPPESSSLLQFVRRVQAAETTQPGPMVVHCSAGVGRTGTFITLDSMLTQAQAEGQVGVFNFVHAMREQRIMMVQTVDQYKFIFDALLESCLTENTAIPVARLQQDYAKLKKRDRKTGTTGIEEQFKMLETFTATYTEDKCRGGLESANVAKNRFPNFIPADKIRPYLMTPGEEGSTNYINAVFLDGYNKKSAYLATQSPLPNTLGDIWRMVFDYNSSCIVMLNSVDSDRNVPQYWPDEGSLQFGRLTVTFRDIDRQSDTVIVRQFGICSSEKKSDKEQSICHIQYLAWPSGKEVPNSPSSLLKVLETVKIWTDDHPDEPVTVHCIDGLGCSGTLCALMTVLESVSQEQVVDVFQAVKKLRAARAGLVQTLAQYQLLYQLTQTSLDSNSIYENLR